MVYKKLCSFDVLHGVKRGLAVFICYIYVTACIAMVSLSMHQPLAYLPLEMRYVKISK
jgi:hypothetical protein